VVTISEPGQLAIGLRRSRIKLTEEIDKLWGTEMTGTREFPGNGQILHSLMGDYMAVCDRLMRICRIPQAPAGSKINEKRPTLDVSEPTAVDAVESPVSAQPQSSNQA